MALSFVTLKRCTWTGREDTHPAHGLNGTGFEEAQFEERVLGIIAGHDPAVPLYLYYPVGPAAICRCL
jgi:hypothetical protein